MTSKQSSVVGQLRALLSVAALVIVSIPVGLGWQRATAASRDDKRHAAAENQSSVPMSMNRPEANLMSVPLSFEPNQGQAASTVQFLSRGSGYALFLSPGKMVLNLERQQPASASVDTLRMSLIGANPKANPVGLTRQPGVVSYFIGNDPKNWRRGIPTYGKVNYAQIYPGVDLVFYGNQRQLEYDFVVAPGADPSCIAWRIDGARASVDAEGNLALSASNGPASFKKPVLYQMDGDTKTSVEGSFAVAGNQIRFRLGSYDHSRALVIDPVLSYASYLGGTDTDTIGATTGPGNLQVGTSQAIAVDSAGSAYVAGTTFSTDLPTKNPYQSAPAIKLGGQPPGSFASAFVSKFSPDGSSLVYSTYLSGNGADHAYAIAVDSNGNAYVTGLTTSPNFPTTAGAYQTVCAPIPNNAGEAAASSNCNSFDYSVFVTKLNSTGTALAYSTFLGGYGNWSYATAIAVDSAGRAYVAGNEDDICQTSYTFQSCFPTTTGAIIGGDKPGGRSPQYAFAAAFDPTGAHLLYSTLFGDLNYDGGGGTYATGVTVDRNGYFYLVGETQAGRLPTTAGVIQPTGAPLYPAGVALSADRGFIAKFAPVTSAGGVSLAYATYLGGLTASVSDYISGVAIDSASNAYVVGYTNSKDFPVTAGAYGTVCAPGGGTCAAAHVTKLNSSASAILWSTYVGGAKHDGSDAVFFTGPIQLDGTGNIYIIGQTGGGPGFPMVNPVEPTPTGGSQQVLVAELDPTGSRLLFSTIIGSNGLNTTNPAGLAVDTAGDIYLAGNTSGPDLITTPGAFQTTSSDGACCQKGNGFVAKIVPTGPGPQISAGGVINAATFQTGAIAPNEFISIFGTGLGPATGVNSAMTTLLSGASISIGGTPAFLIYAQDGQINALVPFGVSGTSTTIQTEFNGVKGNSITVPVVNASPGIFTQAYGPGQAWMLNQDETFNSSSNPAARNSYVAFWVTGQGALTAQLPDGTQPTGPPYPSPVLPVSVSLGGTQLPAANVVFVGLVYSGEIQINLLIPANAPTGSAVPLVVNFGGASSRTDVTVAIE